MSVHTAQGNNAGIDKHYSTGSNVNPQEQVYNLDRIQTGDQSSLVPSREGMVLIFQQSAFLRSIYLTPKLIVNNKIVIKKQLFFRRQIPFETLNERKKKNRNKFLSGLNIFNLPKENNLPGKYCRNTLWCFRKEKKIRLQKKIHT